MARAQPQPAPAPAGSVPQSEKDQRARALFEKGRQAYGDGQYRDAWAYFHEAYQLSGRPELLYNIGQTADRLGQDADALRAFRMYVERLPGASNRHEVENRIRALEERVSSTAQPAPQSLVEPQAQPAARQPVTTLHQDSAPAPPPPRRREPRQGFYLRVALGVGYRVDGISDNVFSANIHGFGPSLDIAAGYAVLPGFVVGGGLFMDWIVGPTLSVGEDGETDLASALLTSFGPFIDWYINRATSGWHVQGSINIGVLSLGRSAALGRSASGIGLWLGGGYEWQISGPWAVGVMARLSISGLTDDTASHGFVSPSLLATLSWF